MKPFFTSKQIAQVRYVLGALHSGAPIPDDEEAALDTAITVLSEVHTLIDSLYIPSMPEYAVFTKALAHDLEALENFQTARSKVDFSKKKFSSLVQQLMDAPTTE